MKPFDSVYRPDEKDISSMVQEEKKKIVIVGGGFGGLRAARGLRRSDADVLLIDRQNYHLFQPLLYQVATAVLSPADIAQPIRKIFRHQPNVTVAMSEVLSIDLSRKRITIHEGTLPYDFLVLAAGATHSYFGHDEWASQAPGLKTIEDALEIRRRILTAFEAAEFEEDEAARQADLTFAVIGGGPTGVELAGAIKEIAVETVARDFRRVDTRTARVLLIEGTDRLLGALPAYCGQRAEKDLRKMGVEIMLGKFVTEVNSQAVELNDGSSIDVNNVFWAAGVKPSPLAQALDVPLDRAGRVIVEKDLSVPGHPEVFVIGDMAHCVDIKTDRLVPGVAPAAMQMGDYVAGLIHDELKNISKKERLPFRYIDKGSMATIGRAKAVASVFGHQFGGFFAWLLWGLVHVLFLIGFRNKLLVMFAWLWNYAISSKGARLITGNIRPKLIKPAVVEPHASQPESPLAESSKN